MKKKMSVWVKVIVLDKNKKVRVLSTLPTLPSEMGEYPSAKTSDF